MLLIRIGSIVSINSFKIVKKVNTSPSKTKSVKYSRHMYKVHINQSTFKINVEFQRKKAKYSIMKTCPKFVKGL